MDAADSAGNQSQHEGPSLIHGFVQAAVAPASAAAVGKILGCCDVALEQTSNTRSHAT